MKVVAVNGSPRKKGNTQDMLDLAAKELRARGIEVSHVSLAERDIRPCDGCERCYKKPYDCPIKDDAVKVLKALAAADGMLVASPVYFGGVTAQLKALMDRSIMAYQAFDLRDKVGGAMSVGGGVHGGQELTVGQIVMFFLTHDIVVANCEGGIYGAMCTGNDRGDAAKDSEGLKSVRSLAKRMADMLEARKG